MNTLNDNTVDLSDLARYNGEFNRVNWNKSIGRKVKFSYKGIDGEFKILKIIPDGKLLILYNGEELEIKKDNVTQGRFVYLVGLRNHNFEYKIGDIIETKYGHVKIIETFYKSNSNNYKTKAYKLVCSECGTEFEMIEYNLKYAIERTENKPLLCPKCRHHIKDGNMWTTFPEVAKYLKDPNDGYIYNGCSTAKVWWTCPECKRDSLKSPVVVKDHGFNCPYYKDTRSYPNKLMCSILNHLNCDFKPEQSFAWSKGRKYDFELNINNKLILIEMMGIQHYEDIFFSYKHKKKRTLIEEQENDILKENLAKENNVDEYIKIDCRISKFDYIKNNILNSKLSEYLDFDNVDWECVKKESESKELFKIAEEWNNGIYDVGILSKKYHHKTGTIVTYLKRLDELGIIKYSPEKVKKEANIRSVKTSYQLYAKPIKCNELNLYFGNTTICSNELKKIGIKANRSNITSHLSGKKKSVASHTFSYISRSEFNQNKINNPDKTFGDLFMSEVKENS